MTVKELIEKLSAFPQDAVVVTDCFIEQRGADFVERVQTFDPKENDLVGKAGDGTGDAPAVVYLGPGHPWD